MKILVRIVAFPFVFALSLIAAVVMIAKFNYAYLRYGGEFITYEKLKPETIKDVLSKYVK